MVQPSTLTGCKPGTNHVLKTYCFSIIHSFLPVMQDSTLYISTVLLLFTKAVMCTWHYQPALLECLFKCCGIHSIEVLGSGIGGSFYGVIPNLGYFGKR